MSILSTLFGSTPTYSTQAATAAPAMADVRSTVARLLSLFPDAPAYQLPTCPAPAPASGASAPPEVPALPATTPSGEAGGAATIHAPVNGEPRMLRFELHVPGKVSIQGRVAVAVLEAALDEIGRYLMGSMALPPSPAR